MRSVLNYGLQSKRKLHWPWVFPSSYGHLLSGFYNHPSVQSVICVQLSFEEIQSSLNWLSNVIQVESLSASVMSTAETPLCRLTLRFSRRGRCQCWSCGWNIFNSEDGGNIFLRNVGINLEEQNIIRGLFLLPSGLFYFNLKIFVSRWLVVVKSVRAFGTYANWATVSFSTGTPHHEVSWLTTHSIPQVV
jgi:hypothetical protein